MFARPAAPPAAAAEFSRDDTVVSYVVDAARTRAGQRRVPALRLLVGQLTISGQQTRGKQSLLAQASQLAHEIFSPRRG